MSDLVIALPGGLGRPSGGTTFDLALAEASRDLGLDVVETAVPGAWPTPSAADIAALDGLLTGPAPILLDGLIGCAAPDSVCRAVAAGVRLHLMLHLPLPLEGGIEPAESRRRASLEARAVTAATGVVVPSRWAAAEVARRYGVAAVVARPGSEPASRAPGSDPPRILHLAAVTPGKDQLTVVDALDLVRDLPWTAELAGPLDADPDYAAEVATAITDRGLGHRVRLSGTVTGADRERVWADCDLALLPSPVETWGLVVTEALARGLPVIVGAGTGAEEALGRAADGNLPGAVVPTGSPVALAAAIRDLLGPGRDRARAAADERRRTLRTWSATARDVHTALGIETRS